MNNQFFNAQTSIALMDMIQSDNVNYVAQSFSNIVSMIGDKDQRLAVLSMASERVKQLEGTTYNKSDSNVCKLSSAMVETFSQIMAVCEVIGRTDKSIKIRKHWLWSDKKMQDSKECKKGQRKGEYYLNNYMINKAYQSYLATAHIVRSV